MNGNERLQGPPRTELAGIPIGDRGDSLEKYTRTIASFGVNIRPDSLSRLRRGVRSGTFTEEQLLLRQTTLCASLKNQLYGAIASNGMELREFQASKPKRYLSTGFTELIAQEIGFPVQDIRNCLRAMRADLIIFSTELPDAALLQLFIPTAHSYLDAYSFPPSCNGAKDKRAIDEKWNRGSIADFYRLLYEKPAPRMIGTWAPYETAVFEEFYRLRELDNVLTPLDRIVQTGYIVVGRNDDLVEDLRRMTATDFNADALTAHANALVFGLPVNPNISEKLRET